MLYILQSSINSVFHGTNNFSCIIFVVNSLFHMHVNHFSWTENQELSWSTFGKLVSLVGHPWWRHQMETLSVSLTLCVGIFSHKSRWRGALVFSLICAWTSGDIFHGDAIKRKHFPRYWHFVWGIRLSLVNSLPTQRPATQNFDVFFDLRLNKRLSKQSTRRWFETPWRSLWRHSNESL